ncbi:MAG TPA: hypothetical protein V6D08_16920 [Candidatus Obscuribacterales bacterium]
MKRPGEAVRGTGVQEMRVVLGYGFLLTLVLTAFGIATITSVAADSDHAQEASTWVNTWMQKITEDGDRHLLGLTKEQLLKRLPETKPYQPGSWRHSKDLTEFTSTLIDHVILIEVRYRNGRVYKVRDSWFNIGDPTIHYGKWIVAGEPPQKR